MASTTTRADRRVLIGAGLFIATGLLLQWWRLEALQASYDQGVFLQSIWNGLRGHPFESTLSSQLSTNVLHSGEPPSVGYHRLGQHFTPALLLWVPLVGVLGKWALPLVQVGLMTGAGLVLHRLARQRLEPGLAAMLTIAFYGANAVLGPTWGNFTDLCQLPICVFALLLALEHRRPWLIALAALPIVIWRLARAGARAQGELPAWSPLVALALLLCDADLALVAVEGLATLPAAALLASTRASMFFFWAAIRASTTRRPRPWPCKSPATTTSQSTAR